MGVTAVSIQLFVRALIPDLGGIPSAFLNSVDSSIYPSKPFSAAFLRSSSVTSYISEIAGGMTPKQLPYPAECLCSASHFSSLVDGGSEKWIPRHHVTRYSNVTESSRDVNAECMEFDCSTVAWLAFRTDRRACLNHIVGTTGGITCQTAC